MYLSERKRAIIELVKEGKEVSSLKIYDVLGYEPGTPECHHTYTILKEFVKENLLIEVRPYVYKKRESCKFKKALKTCEDHRKLEKQPQPPIETF